MIPGGDMVRPYWDRYYQTFQGIIFVIDSSSEEDRLTLAKTEMYKAIQHHQLKGIPLLVVATGKGKENARSTDEICWVRVHPKTIIMYVFSKE